jgi:hypothetical protein
MMHSINLKYASLTLFLLIGFSLPNCVDCDCPKNTPPYFDIKGLDVQVYKNAACCGNPYNSNSVIDVNELQRITLAYEVDFLASQFKHSDAGECWSLMPSLLACSCNDPGYLGAKNEQLSNVVVTTLYHFDNDHPAGSSLNDVLLVEEPSGRTLLDHFLSKPPSLIASQWNQFLLAKKPQGADTFQVSVALKLSNNESYIAKSVPLVIQ